MMCSLWLKSTRHLDSRLIIMSGQAANCVKKKSEGWISFSSLPLNPHSDWAMVQNVPLCLM